MADEMKREEQVEAAEESREEIQVRQEEEATETAASEEASDTEASSENQEEEAVSAEENTETGEMEESEEEEASAPEPVPVPTDPQGRVVAAREKVLSAEEEIEACMEKIRKDLEEFEAYEREHLVPVVEESQRLLESLGMEEEAIEPALAELELENPEEEKLEIRDLSSGKGGAFFWGFVAAVATVGGWYAYATQKAGAALIPTQAPDMGTLSSLAGKVSLLLGPAENPSVGAAVVIGSALVVWWLVYIVLVSLRAAKNRRIAEEVEEQAGFYCQKKEECKAMMEKVREHLKSLHQTVEKYEVLLDEKNAGLRRAIFIEEADSFDKLHDRSKEMAREMDALLKELDRLLATPMARSGVLTPESAEALRHAKRVINDHILRLYS